MDDQDIKRIVLEITATAVAVIILLAIILWWSL